MNYVNKKAGLIAKPTRHVLAARNEFYDLFRDGAFCGCLSKDTVELSQAWEMEELAHHNMRCLSLRDILNNTSIRDEDYTKLMEMVESRIKT